ncbi:MAG: zinc ribbon domain-containing protein [candidate division WOR-3 bacterium]|nr:MAG: zinc ribbon domain-containing protein [candidate division WOR-3 bacterium]
MPTYEYECLFCRYKFDEFQKITDKPLTQCPKCKGKVRRLISGGAGLIFKGNGFYVTDYKRSHLPEMKKEKSTDLKKPDAKPKPPAKTSKDSKE